MAAAMKRFWDWANQPVSLGKKKPLPTDTIPVLNEPNDAPHTAGLPENIASLDLNLESLASANDEMDSPLHFQPPEPTNPEDYLGETADDAVDGLERYLAAHAISGASEQSWVHLVDEMKVIQLKRLRLTELENECVKIKAELQECKKNLAMQAKRASAEECMTILMHEKRLELARAVSRRVDAL
jgi:hypothetical protein